MLTSFGLPLPLLHFLLLLFCLKTTAQEESSRSEKLAVAAKLKQKRVEEEEFEIGFIQSLLVDSAPIASFQSKYQTIEIYENQHFGKVFLLDENLQLTERDAPHYNEMLAHVPMMEYLATSGSSYSDGQSMEEAANINVLVIGGGDGFVVSELLKYPNIGSIDHVDLDEGVIQLSKEHFNWSSSAWNDKRVNLIIGDGAAFVKDQVQKEKMYHVIIQDASDPFWYEENGELTTSPSHVLYDIQHFEYLYKLLKETNGVLVFQAETYNIPSNLKAIKQWRRNLEKIGFGYVRYGSISVPTYSTGQIGFFVAHASRTNETEDVDNNVVCKSEAEACGMRLAASLIDWNVVSSTFQNLNGATKYYHPRIHRSAFDLPLWVEEAIYGKLMQLM